MNRHSQFQVRKSLYEEETLLVIRILSTWAWVKNPACSIVVRWPFRGVSPSSFSTMSSTTCSRCHQLIDLFFQSNNKKRLQEAITPALRDLHWYARGSDFPPPSMLASSPPCPPGFRNSFIDQSELDSTLPSKPLPTVPISVAVLHLHQLREKSSIPDNLDKKANCFSQDQIYDLDMVSEHVQLGVVQFSRLFFDGLVMTHNIVSLGIKLTWLNIEVAKFLLWLHRCDFQ